MLLNDFDRMLAELIAFRKAGGNSIVEVTCDGWGRDLDVLAKLSEKAEVHIIATSGYYIEPHIPLFVDSMPLNMIADRLTDEIVSGVGTEKRKCGVFKSAIHKSRVEGLELKVLQAIAIAHKRTGVPITTHTTASRSMEVKGGIAGIEQLDILKSEGVSPTALIMGHVDQRPDIDVLIALAQQGCFIQFDLIGKEHYVKDSTRAAIIHRLIREGYLNNILLSQDRNRSYEMRYGGNTGYCHIFEVFIPLLRERGVSLSDIEIMMCANPARAFSFE
jgi:phosphotriesterase-related protein